jgi:nucleotide-binding universal stress UspA family protein
MKLSRIVCASDSREVSAAVLSYAMALAEWEDADLRVVHVAGSRQEHALYVPVVSRTRATTVVVPGGDPAAAIVGYARGVRADLIVIGATLPRSGAEQRGRLAEVVARDAHCPTLIVPLSLPHRRDELPFRNILCPVDFSPSSVLACERALRLAQQAGGTLTLLHVLDEFRYGATMSASSRPKTTPVGWQRPGHD